MNHLWQSGLYWTLDAAWKGALVLALALLAVVWLRRLSASMKHGILTAAFVASLTIPWFSLCLPSWPLLPAWSSQENGVEFVLHNEEIVAPTQASPVSARVEEANAVDEAPPKTQAAQPEPAVATPTQVQPLAVLAIAAASIYLLGFLWLLSRIARAYVALHSRRATLVESDDPRWLAALETAAAKLQIRMDRIEVRLAPHPVMAMMWGVWRPCIVLPADAAKWTTDKLHAVLTHELAHVRRQDCLWDLIAQVTRAVFWFNPLVWVAYRQHKLLRESACDDLVLSAGVPATDYAECLLQFSDDNQPPDKQPHWAAALSMARPSTLHRRLLAILQPKANRSPLSWAGCGGLFAMTTLMAASLAMVSAADGEAAIRAPDAPAIANPEVQNQTGAAIPEAQAAISTDQETKKRPRTETSVNTRQAGPKKAKDKSKEKPGQVIAIVVDHQGKPVRGALVRIHGKRRKVSLPKQEVPFSRELKTNESGGFIIKPPKARERFTVLQVSSKQLNFFGLSIKALPKRKLTIRLPKPASLTVKMNIPFANHTGEHRMALNSKIPRIEKAGKEGAVRLQFNVWENKDKDWRMIGFNAQRFLVKNPGEITIRGLGPGKYHLSRAKFAKVAGFSVGGYLNRQEFTLKPGEHRVIEWVVKNGHRVRGVVQGIPKTSDGVILTVRSADASEKIRSLDWKKPTFDTIGVKPDGKFITAQLSPGKYKVIAHAYNRVSLKAFTGIPVPSHIGFVVVTVAAKGPAKKITITMKPNK